MGETGTNTVTVPVSINVVTVMEIQPVREGVYDIKTFPFEGEVRSVDEIQLPAMIILDADSDPDLEKCDENARLLVAFLFERERVYTEWLSEHDTWLAENPEEAAKHTKWVCAHPDWIVEHFQWLSEQPDWADYCAAWEADGRPTTAKKTRASSRSVKNLAEVPTALLKPNLSKGEMVAINDETDKPIEIEKLFADTELLANITADKNGFHIQIPGTKTDIIGELAPMKPSVDLSTIDMRPAYMMYSIIARDILMKLEAGLSQNVGLSYNDAVNYGVNVSVKDLGDAMFAAHKNKGYTKDAIKTIIERITQYHGVIGILSSKSDPRAQSKYPILQWRGYSAKTNTIAFGSPFFAVLIRQILIDSGKLDKNGMPRLNSHKKIPMFKINSALIKSNILAQRNRRACDIVSIICNLIENSTNTKNPTISAYGIIEKMPEFRDFLNAASPPVRSKTLKNAFERAFELLRTHTYLQYVYPGIELPSPGDYPKWTALRTTRYYFSHNGIDEDTYELILKGDFEKVQTRT